MVKAALAPVVMVVAILYFLIDGLFLVIVKPLAARLARLPVFVRVAAWVGALGPYPTLVLFLVPIAILEPIKPLGLYLIGTGRVVDGVLLIGLGEVLKITLVERLFHMSSGKLMSIRAFAWAYTFVARRLARLQALPAWQAALKCFRTIKAAAHRLFLAVKG